MTLAAGLAGVGGSAMGQALNDTGAVQCIDGAGGLIGSCLGTGQDGGAGRDVAFPDAADGLAGFSYRKVCHSGEFAGQGGCPADPAPGAALADWGCTLDTVTGLLWELKTTDGGPRDRLRVYTNLLPSAPGHGGPRDATGYVNAVNATGLCGRTGWAVPTRLQLESLLNYGLPTPGPMLDARFFPTTVNRAHWSRDASATGSASQPAAVGVQTDTGQVTWAWRTQTYPVLLVRPLSPLPPGPRYTASADGQEVTDAHTGLTWRRCVEGMAWNGSTCTGSALGLTWLQALGRAGGAWRMPNLRELSSLVDDTRKAPTIDTAAFPGTPARWFWSSTPAGGDPAYVWSVQFRDGSLTTHAQPNEDYRRHVRLVRGGP